MSDTQGLLRVVIVDDEEPARLALRQDLSSLADVEIVARLDARRQPCRGLRWVVLEEGTELAPTRRAVDERNLANDDAAELHPHRQGDDMQAVDDVGY